MLVAQVTLLEGEGEGAADHHHHLEEEEGVEEMEEALLGSEMATMSKFGGCRPFDAITTHWGSRAVYQLRERSDSYINARLWQLGKPSYRNLTVEVRQGMSRCSKD